jgi:hypothetical protein
MPLPLQVLTYVRAAHDGPNGGVAETEPPRWATHWTCKKGKLLCCFLEVIGTFTTCLSEFGVLFHGLTLVQIDIISQRNPILASQSLKTAFLAIWGQKLLQENSYKCSLSWKNYKKLSENSGRLCFIDKWTTQPPSGHTVSPTLSPYVIEWIAKLCRDALGVIFCIDKPSLLLYWYT